MYKSILFLIGKPEADQYSTKISSCYRAQNEMEEFPIRARKDKGGFVVVCKTLLSWPKA